MYGRDLVCWQTWLPTLSGEALAKFPSQPPIALVRLDCSARLPIQANPAIRSAVHERLRILTGAEQRTILRLLAFVNREFVGFGLREFG